MDGKIYYQPIAIDTEAGMYRTIRNGIKFKTAWEAEDELLHLASRMARQIIRASSLGGAGSSLNPNARTQTSQRLQARRMTWEPETSSASPTSA